jgi:hypothetical protein
MTSQFGRRSFLKQGGLAAAPLTLPFSACRTTSGRSRAGKVRGA